MLRPVMTGRFSFVARGLLAVSIALVFSARVVFAGPQVSDSLPPAEESPDTDVELELVEVLRARLRPMTKESAEQELVVWFDALVHKCAEVSQIEIAAIQADDPDAIAELNERAVGLRAERANLIVHIEVVTEMVERKGGDVTDVLAYVESVEDVPPVTGLKAGLATARAWLTNPDGGIALALSIGRALSVIFVAWLVSIVLGRLTARVLGRSQRASVLLRTFVIKAVRRTSVLLGVLVALSGLGLNMGPMLAAIGAAGLVIGLALQGTLSNFASGLMIMIYRPFDVGDVISAAGILGTVEGMTLVTTTVCTLDNQAISIPNNTVWGDVIINLTAKKTRRIDMLFGIGYSDDFDQARDVLMGILTSHDKILSDPEPIVQMHELGDSSVNFIVRPWVKTADFWQVRWDVTRAVKERFDAEGISIPFPQRDVHFYAAGSTERAGDAGGGSVLQPARAPGPAAPVEETRG